jgi:hypothetical protein
VKEGREKGKIGKGNSVDEKTTEDARLKQIKLAI